MFIKKIDVIPILIFLIMITGIILLIVFINDTLWGKYVYKDFSKISVSSMNDSIVTGFFVFISSCIIGLSITQLGNKK
tara:strand:- start:176 stop:409 length:234 start_codon:yes stop_codon:yes gene_type:complete